MTLDTGSLRVSFALVALTLVLLFYVITYRNGRSAYAAWWCISLALFLIGASAYLLSGTTHQVWANPLGNALIALGAGCVWAGSRSLRRDRPALPRSLLAIAPIVVGTMSVLGDPATDVWSGGEFFLAAMWIQLGLAGVELRGLLGHAIAAADPDGHGYRATVWALLLACCTVAAFYLGRWIAFLAVGPDQPLFATFFGEQVTTLATTVLLATVSFSMSTLSEEQQKEALRDTAARDGLTGLLNRRAFVQLAEAARRARRDSGGSAASDGVAGSLIMADLDHFKQLNDQYGHPAGDRALVAFADCCRAAVRSTDLVARYGGEEFVILLPGADAARAELVSHMISTGLAERSQPELPMPTVSFGVAELDPALPLDQVVERADLALYRAKSTGRDRTVHYTPEIRP
jgi:diguanylate cyclase (GGDEF)-like protein